MLMKNSRQKCEQLERHAKYKTDHNALAQYSCWNNVILSGISDSVSDDTLEESVIFVLAAIDVYVEHQEIGVCHRFAKPGRQ